jgi:hypothetical protein
MTAIEKHIEIMKQELLVMQNSDIRFGYLLKLIREAKQLIEAETKTAIS